MTPTENTFGLAEIHFMFSKTDFVLFTVWCNKMFAQHHGCIQSDSICGHLARI